MKTTKHGIEDSRDVENVYHMRLMALLQELVREKGYKGASRVLVIDPATVTESAKTGQLTRRVRQALERALQEGVGSAAERQRRRNEEVEGRVEKLEGEVETLGKGARRRLSAIEGEVAALRRDDHQGTGAGHAGDGPSRGGADEAEAGAARAGRKPPSKPRVRREYPDLATREPAPDDEEIFGEAWPLIVEWRGLKAVPSSSWRSGCKASSLRSHCSRSDECPTKLVGLNRLPTHPVRKPGAPLLPPLDTACFFLPCLSGVPLVLFPRIRPKTLQNRWLITPCLAPYSSCHNLR